MTRSSKNINLKPGNLIECVRENFLFCKEDFGPHIVNGCLVMPDVGEVMMYLDKKTLNNKTYYKVLYIKEIFYIRSEAFKSTKDSDK